MAAFNTPCASVKLPRNRSISPRFEIDLTTYGCPSGSVWYLIAKASLCAASCTSRLPLNPAATARSSRAAATRSSLPGICLHISRNSLAAASASGQRPADWNSRARPWSDSATSKLFPGNNCRLISNACRSKGSASLCLNWSNSLIVLADLPVEACDQNAQMGFDCRLIVQFCADALGCPIQNVLQIGPDIPPQATEAPTPLSMSSRS